MVFVNRCALTMCLTAQCLILIAAQGPGPGAKKRSPNSDLAFSSQMQSRAVDTRVQLEIPEGQPRGTVVGSIPIKPGFIYRFNESPKEFVLNETTGEIRTTVILDRESLKNDRFDLVVLSSQPTYPIEVRVLVLDVNDNAPEFPEPSISVLFSENAVSGTKLLLDTATDRDIGINKVTDDYQIVSGNTDDKFRLEVTHNPSGDTSYLYLKTTEKLDREVVAFYQLNISARDGGEPTHYGYLQVNVTVLDVNDNPPIFATNDYSTSFNESSPVGTKVLRVLATDEDDGDNAKISYYLAENERRFSVDADSGDIYTAEVLDCPHQNCPQMQQPKHGKSCPKSCVFTVYARDHGSPQQDGRAYVTVNLLDANDHDPVIKFSYFPSTAPFATVDENAMNGSVVAAVSVVDPDDGLNGETTVTIKAGNELHHFRMESGQSFDLIRVNGVLDREHINKYNLTVVASDKGTPARTVTSFLIIYVNDVNDHEPVFEKSEYSALLNELTAVGTYVASITATDEDSGVNALIYYSIVSGNELRWFNMDSETGLITTRAELDREKSGTVELKISAHDGGPNPKFAYTQLKVTVLDENDEKPKFAQDVANISVSEDIPENSQLTVVTAVDHDQGTNGSVIYTLHADTQAKYPSTFSIHPVTGQLVVIKKLDRETIPAYQIKVLAKDQGSPAQSATATVFLTLSDANDNAPVFYPMWYFARVNDTTAPGSAILNVYATDYDLNDKISYKIENNAAADDALFYINELTGTIYLKSPIAGRRGENSFRLAISASDKDGKKALDNAIVEIIRNTGDDDEVAFENDNYVFQTREDDGLRDEYVERELGKVKIKSKNSNYDLVQYFIVSGDSKHMFEIGERSGIIRTNNKIDREQQSTYTLTVVAKMGSSVAKTRINVTIQDLNDNKPQFANEKDEITVVENTAVGQEIFLVRAKDRDSGVNSRITYSMASDSDQFRIASDSGVVYLNKPLKCAPGTVLNAEIKATDSGTPSLWAKHSISITVLDVNDHTPIFEKMYEISLPESITVNERFIPVVANDEDFGLNGALKYHLIDGNQDGKFGIFPDGYVYVRKKLDREEKDYYCLTVEAKDSGYPERSSNVPLIVHVIDENDNKPEFVNTSFIFHVKENEPADTFVGKILAIDKDVGRNAELIYALLGKQNDFIIDPKNGFIRTARTFDRELLVQTTGQNYVTLEATVSDNGVPRLHDKVKINIYIDDVNDNAPQFLRVPYKVFISESSPVGTQVLRVFTSDADEGLNRDVFYLIAAGNEEKRFVIDKATGQITVSKHLDREKTTHYELIVTAYDAGAKSLTSNATVAIEITDENDNAPVFQNVESHMTISENAPLNSKLYQFSATDSDSGVNSEIFFSIGSGNRRESFQIDSLTGMLYLRKKLDYEDVTSYILNITAFDGGNPRLSTTLLFTVTVEDCNDNPPAFPSTAIVRQIRENIPTNTPIVTVTAEDPDSGLNGKIMYSIVKQEPAQNSTTFHFQINPKTGVIHTQLPIDRETVDTFRLTIRATDQAPVEADRLFAEKMVTVIVEDINDNAPTFVSMNAAVLKGTATDMLVMNVLAKDPDSGTNGMVTYDLFGSNLDLFYIQRNTGALFLKKHIAETKIKYQLSVKATDEAVQSDRRSTDQYITIFTPASKNELVFSDEFNGNVYENEPIGTNILTVSARHIHNIQYDVEYYITNVTGIDGRLENCIFDVDPKLGIVSTAVVLDRESGSEWYDVEVYAIAVNNLTPVSGVTKVRIDVLDKNDSPPSFSEMPTEFSVSEDLPVDHVVTTVKVTDPDTPTRITFSLVGGDTEKFHLDADTGVLSLTDLLDRETKSKHRLIVQASDGIQKTEATFTITVTDTNDNPPVFSESVYSFDVAENDGRGTKIGQIAATDEDENVNGLITYAVISDWANDIFSLNPQTGIFTLTAKLDYEEVQHYVFTVQAQDSGRPALSSTVTVYINVIDLNDNPPVFESSSYTAELLENVTVGTPVLTLLAKDLDSGENGRIEYEMVNEDKETDFVIDSKNGTVFTNRMLDRETHSVYNLIVLAKDKAKYPQQRLTATVQVAITIKDVNDMSPEFLISNETSVPENTAINTVVTVVKAVDKDEGRNSYLEYSLTDSAGGMFTLGSADGLLRVNGKLDRETKANYTLKVKAKDRGEPPRQTEMELVVRVLDENDNSPTFNPKQYSAFVPENASIGVTILQVFANDEDEGANGRIRYTITEGDENRDFTIGEDSGILRVGKNLNYERRNKYLLTIKAEDNEGNSDLPIRSDVATISITITDVNDNFPVFLHSPYYAYVMENAVPQPNGYVLTVKAFDFDSAPFNSQIRYFLKEGDLDLFRINASSGDISLLMPLDREKQAEHVLSVVAMDAGSPPLTGTGTVHVFVQDVNDHSPQFERTDYVAFVGENLPPGSDVIHVQAIDYDAGLNSKLRYSLLGERVERFQVNSETGLIETKVPLDREDVSVYRLTLVAQDSSVTEPKASTVNLLINVLDENDNAPVFADTQLTVHVADRIQPGEFVCGVIASDVDSAENSRIEYSISGPDANKFTLNSKTGVIKTAKELRPEEGAGSGTYKIIVQASDGGKVRKTSTIQITVKLRPAQLFPVIVTPKESVFVLPENCAPGKVVTRLKATSPKHGNAGIIRFAIAGGNIGDAFKVDVNTGEVTVSDGKLDYELSTQYEIWVEAEDSDVVPLRSVVPIMVNVTDVNDNAPIFDNLTYHGAVYEEEYPPQSVLKVKARDRDSGLNGKVMYRLKTDTNAAFTINAKTGEIKTSVRLDREQTDSYQLTVEAYDEGIPSLKSVASVYVTVLDKNDNPPKFTRLFSVNVTENADPGDFVIQITSSDQDIGENANATFSFAENPGNKFAIDPSSGNVTVVGPLDREVEDEYLLKVVAVDGSWRAETPLTITVQDQNDNAPEFENSYYNFYFPENNQNGAFIGQLIAQDKDKQGPNSLITYSLTHPSDYFSIDPSSAEIFCKKKLRYKYSILDSSPENQYSFTVVATDNGKPPLSSECHVTVNVINANNNAPKFEQKDYFSPVPETASVGLKIARVKALDNLDYGINAAIEYTKLIGNDSDMFAVGKTDGWITLLRSAKNVKHLTRYTLQIRASDHGIPPKHDQATVTLVICGENNHTPVFSALSYQVTVPENEPAGSTILTVVATDEDEGPNGMIRYSMNKTELAEEKFRVNPVTGAVTILQPLDYDQTNEYRLNVIATDLGFVSKSAVATLTVLLADINDNAPLFNSSLFEVYISEKLPANSAVTQIMATDNDSPKYAIIRYSIAGGSGKELFKIDSRTGTIYSTVKFDFEEKDKYTLEVTASNPDSSMQSSAVINMYITGENEFYPRFLQPVFHYDISESAAIGSYVGTVQATDQDAGDDGVVYYLFVGSSNDKGFAVNSLTGAITVSKRLDRETQNRVVLTVMAKNAGSIRGNDTDEAQVIISIQDGNDPPEFYSSLYEAEISENVEIGTKVINVKAFDKDVKQQHNQFSYSIINGNLEKAFKIDSQTGEIETSARLDRETAPFYNLIVAAIDTGTPPETGTATVKISITDVNDNGPIFEPASPAGYVNENEAPGTVVMTLNARDPDLPPNGAPFTYSIVGGMYKNLFSLGSQSGVITALQPLDREATPQIDLMVSVEDNGEPRMKSIHTVKIFVQDQNDSPSTPRSVHVVVHSFNDLFPTGKIANVRPNDPDLTGDYKCRLLNDPVTRGVLSIPIGCDLHASKIVLGSGFAFSVLGNDGKHSDVVSSVTVEFLSFNNNTIDNSLIVRIENMTAVKFLSRYYKEFSDSLRNISNNGDTPFLFSLYDNDNGLEIALALRDADGGYRSPEQVRQRLAKRQNLFKQLFQSNVILGYSPCKNNVCENGGACKDEMMVIPETVVTDSQTLVFTSPLVKHDFTCYCTESYTGKKCEKRQDPCTPNPCQAGGTCRKQGVDFQCHCPAKRKGALCEEERIDKCDENPCQNGGSCRESPDSSSYFCLCRPGYRGNQCEIIADSCRPNPCLNGGFCVGLKPGYKCNCPEGLHGRHCEKSTFGFSDLSYMTFPALDLNTNDISVTFATMKLDSLLVYNYGVQTGGRSDFVALELVDGKAVFSYGGTRTAITSIRVPQNSANSLADGNWHKITATRNGRVVSLSVALCTENGDSCQECKPGDVSCYTDDTGPSGTLNFNNNPLYIGGLATADAILERPGQVHSDDFVGCIHSISINGRHLNLSSPIKSFGVEPMCNRSSQSLCRNYGNNLESNSICGTGNCYDQWKKVSCVCDDSGTVAPNCNSALEPVTLTEGGFVEYKISEKHRRLQLLENIYGGSTLWYSRYAADRSRRQLEEKTDRAMKYVALTFRTIRSNGLLLFFATDKDFTVIEMVNGQIMYRSKLGKATPVNMSVDSNEILSDGQWHHLKLQVYQRVLRVYIDGEKVGEELDSESVHNFLDPYLTLLSVGGLAKEYSALTDLAITPFAGCLANLTVNGEIQPFSGSGSIYQEVIHHGKVTIGCTGPIVSGAVSNPDPLRIGVSLVVVFFMTLLIAIIVSFMAFRLRRQKKEKPGVGHMKQNGGPNLVNNGGVMSGAGDVIRTALHNDSGVPPYMTDNTDIIRGVTGHHMVAPELISKRYKDQEMTAMEQMQRSQRPDIIEREVVGKSPPPREEHHPPPPQVNHHPHDSSHSQGDHDLPEHYDLENSSSIAPSDIDIICHYKSYRDGGNMRKYKLVPPHVPPPAASLYHKHNIQHRHSPLHSSGFTVHSRENSHSVVRPPPVSRVDSPKQINLQHQSTPLARLSPSSELSQQMPRILTLQDISGKPLQSALLATTSSSGGVGKDALHTNSERSLNSPVMSQLSGRSSSESRKMAGPPSHDNSADSNVGLSIGLSANEISRLAAHPRNSSLVSTLDVVSCSSGRVDTTTNPHHHLHHNSANVIDDNHSSTSTDESGNDSFTCSEIEYDNNSVSGEKLSDVLLSNLADDDRNRSRSSDRSGSNKPPPLPPYSNFDSSFRGSLSTLVASDDDIARVPMFRPQNNSPSSIPTALGWEYLLNWGPNFENFAGVFKDIAELPESVNSRMNGSLRSQNKNNKSSEEYV